jgi:phage baseplate assembly protein W
MTTYIGYNTINQVKKFTLTDSELVKRDLLNSIMIREGEMPGRPEVGTNIWSYVFDPNTNDVVRKIKAEIQRLIDADPRIQAEEINVFAKDHNILIEMNVRILPSVDLEVINLIFDQNTNSAKFAS